LALRREIGAPGPLAESLFHVALVHQVVRGDTAAALPYLEEARALALAATDEVTLSYVERHLGFLRSEQVDHRAAEAAFRESLRLREQAGFLAGVGPALLALAALLAQAPGRAGEAAGLIRRALPILRGLGATAYVERAEVDLARLSDRSPGYA
jgi:tetratricopeptide (TPR) repeat protein